MMMASFAPLAFSGDWYTWGIVAAGFVSAAVVFALGIRLWIGRSSANQLSPEEQGDPIALGSRTDRRSAHRRKGSTIMVKLTDKDNHFPPFEGWVLNRSMSGMGLAVKREIAAGTILNAHPHQAPPGTPWVQLEVKCCNAEEGEWVIGCAFVKMPPYNILLLFG